MRGRAAKVPAQGAGAGDEVPARCRGKWRRSDTGVTRILLYEGCRYGRSSVKDTPSHSCGTLWYPCGTIHGVPCSRTSLTLSGVRPLAGARRVHFGDPPTRTLLFVVQYWCLARLTCASRAGCVYAVGGDITALRAYGVARMYTHNNIPPRPT